MKDKGWNITMGTMKKYVVPKSSVDQMVSQHCAYMSGPNLALSLFCIGSCKVPVPEQGKFIPVMAPPWHDH
jgi:hypothetical protein